jgi:hypothetical protein
MPEDERGWHQAFDADAPPHGGHYRDGRMRAGHRLHEHHRHDPGDYSRGRAGCTAIGRMALDLHQGATSTNRRVSGRLWVWAVTMSSTTGTACGRRDRSRGSLLGTLASDGTQLEADRFHLLGVPYGWLTANITTFPVTPTMQMQQLQGRFGAGRSHHRLLHGTFTVTRANNRAVQRTYP